MNFQAPEKNNKGWFVVFFEHPSFPGKVFRSEVYWDGKEWRVPLFHKDSKMLAYKEL